MSNTDDHGPGSLRQAIVDANDNANVSGFPDEIDFDIPGSGLQVISPLIGLPPIIDPVVIDGYTQPGSSPNTVLDGDSAILLIVLDGSLAPFADGLQLYAGNSTVRGLVINQFTIGINVSSPGSNVIEGNFIGTDATGLVDLGNTDAGIAVRDSPDNTIGGATPEARNVISGTKVSFLNTGQGIAITGPSSIGNLVQGNFIGTDATGAQALSNGGDGVLVSSRGLGGSASQTTISGNLISGNARNGIEIVGGGNNLVAGNLIGTDVSGTKDLGNAHDGVVISDTTDTGVVVATTGNNTVGGTTATARNVISGNDAERRRHRRRYGGRQPGAGQLHRHEYPWPDRPGGGPRQLGRRRPDHPVGRRRPYRVQQQDRRDHGRGTQRHFGQPPWTASRSAATAVRSGT